MPLGLQGKVYPFFHVLALVDGVWSIRNWNQVLGCMWFIDGVPVCLREVWVVYLPPWWMALLVRLGGIEGVEQIHCGRHDS